MAKQVALKKAQDFTTAAEMGMRARRRMYEALFNMPNISDGALDAARLDVLSAMEVVLDAQREQNRIIRDIVYPSG
jgi:hypothetical protein